MSHSLQLRNFIKRPKIMDMPQLLLVVILLQCNSAFAIRKLSDTVVLAGDSTILNCSGSSINWYRYHFGKESQYDDVYMNNAIEEKYVAFGFHIDGDSSNLIIENVTTDFAGKYECKDIDKNEGHLTEVVVIEKLPECHVNMDEFIGPNDCNVPPDAIQLSCSARYRGNKPPQLEWRRHGEAIEVLESKCTTEDNSLTICSTTVKPDVTMNVTTKYNPYFVCQTTKRAANEQYYCTANVTVLYSFGSEESKRTAAYTGDRVECTANSSQSCSYKWVWYEKVGDDLSRTIESTDNVLFAKKSGLHRCEAQCDLRNHKCLVFPKFLDVFQSENSAEYNGLHQTFEQENNQWIPSLTSSLLLVVLLFFAFGCYLLFTRNRSKKPSDESQNTSSESVNQPQD